MENSSNSVDLNDWLMPVETVKSEQTVQHDVTAKWTDFIGKSHGELTYRSSMFINRKQPPTASTKGPETICGSKSHNCRSEESVLDWINRDGFRSSSSECSGPTDTVCDSHRYLSRWLMPENPMKSMKETCHGVEDICGQMGSFKGPDPGLALDWKNKDECRSPGFECSGPAAPFYHTQDSYKPGDIISEWLQPMESREYDCRPSIGYDEWLAPQTDPILSLDKTEYGYRPSMGYTEWLMPTESFEMDQFGRQCGPIGGQTTFCVHNDIQPPKWQSTPIGQTGLRSKSDTLLIESMEHEIKDLKDTLSRKNEEFLSLENDFEVLLNKLDESEQKRMDSKSKASNTIELANGEIEIANNYIEMLKKHLLEKDEQIHSLQKALTLSKPKRSKMSAQCVKEKSTKVQLQKSSLEQGATGGEIQMSHTLSDGMSVSDKPDGPGLSKSDTDISQQNDGKPAVKIKHYSFSSYLDKRSKADIEKCQQIRYYLNQCTDMMERLNQSPDPSDLGRVKTLEQVMQRLTENLTVLENPGDLQSTTK